MTHVIEPSSGDAPAGMTAALAALEALGRNLAFSRVTPQHRRDLATHGRKRLFTAGTPLMKQGDQSTAAYLLVKGRVKVERRESEAENALALAELGPGELVGEMGVLSHAPRSATVTAMEDLETLELTADALREVFHDDPDVLLAFVKIMHERMHDGAGANGERSRGHPR